MESSNFQPPVRSSLSNDELEARVNQAMTSHSGVEAVMELLVAQEALRAQEDQEEALWVERMRANGSPEAMSSLQAFLGTGSSLSVSPNSEIQQHSAPELDTEEISQDLPLVVEVDSSSVEEIREPELNRPEPTFSWMNPAPPVVASTPVVEIEPVEEFTPQAIVHEEHTSETNQEVPESTPSTFSWFTKEVEPIAEVSEPLVIVEQPLEAVVVEGEATHLEAVGSESETEFEKLLAAAAAEEELTALEERESKTLLIAPSTNVLIPSDEHRNRGPLSQLWVWVGISATVIPIALVWALIGLGLNALAIALALSIGFLTSGILIAVAAISGKRSGLSTAIISRAVFGVWGNSIPLTVVYLSRVAITAVMLGGFTFLMNGAEARLPDFSVIVYSFAGVNLTVGLVVQLIFVAIISLVVLVRGNVSRVIQVLLSVLAFVLVAETFLAVPGAGFTFVSAGSLDIISLSGLAGIALVIMVNLGLWFALAPNISKAIPMQVRGAKVFAAVLVANFVVPVLVGIAAIFWLGSLSVTGVSTIQEAVQVLPQWAQGTLASGVSIAIVFAAMLSLRTATLDAISLFRFRSRVPALVISSLATVALLALFAQQPIGLEVEYLTNVFVVASALTAGWIGIFAADVAIRRHAYHELSLSRSYGLYKKFNVLSILTWLATLVFAIAFIPVNLLGRDFAGFALAYVGLEPNLGTSALGFVATTLLGMLLTFAVRIPQIKKQEREVLALESRRDQLNDIFVGTD